MYLSTFQDILKSWKQKLKSQLSPPCRCCDSMGCPVQTGEVEKWGCDEMSPSGGLKGGTFKWSILQVVPAGLRRGHPSLCRKAYPCPTRGNLVMERTVLCFCTKLLSASFSTSLLSGRLLSEPLTIPLIRGSGSCPQTSSWLPALPQPIFLPASSHQDLAPLSTEHKLTSAQGCVDVISSSDRGQQWSLRKMMKRIKLCRHPKPMPASL